MRIKNISILSTLVVAMVGCSSNIPKANHRSGRGIVQIDQLVNELLPEYINECYEPIKAREVPNNGCQTTLFDVLERRHGMSFSKVQLNRIAEELFFTQYISDRLNSLVKSDPRVRAQVKSQFHSKEELIGYYRKVYSFERL